MCPREGRGIAPKPRDAARVLVGAQRAASTGKHFLSAPRSFTSVQRIVATAAPSRASRPAPVRRPRAVHFSAAHAINTSQYQSTHRPDRFGRRLVAGPPARPFANAAAAESSRARRAAPSASPVDEHAYATNASSASRCLGVTHAIAAVGHCPSLCMSYAAPRSASVGCQMVSPRRASLRMSDASRVHSNAGWRSTQQQYGRDARRGTGKGPRTRRPRDLLACSLNDGSYARRDATNGARRDGCAVDRRSRRVVAEDGGVGGEDAARHASARRRRRTRPGGIVSFARGRRL